MKDLLDEYCKEVVYPLDDRDVLKKEQQDAVYVVYNPTTKLTKIGITGDFTQRINMLSTQGGVRLTPIVALRLERYYDEKAEDIERFLHKFFHNKRELGEWFGLNIKDYIQIRDLFLYIGGDDMIDNVRPFYLGHGFIERNLQSGMFDKDNNLVI